MRVKFEYSDDSKSKTLVDMKERFTQSQHERVAARLTELANGAPPESSICGICNDVDEMCGVNGYEYMSNVFTLMGLDNACPLQQEEWEDAQGYCGKWEGLNGHERRALARDAASTIRQLFLE